MNALDKARELGAEHGKAAAEAWLARETRADGLGSLTKYPRSMVAGYVARGEGGQLYAWPEPDPRALGPRTRETEYAYCAAFREAVEATIREAVR